MSGDNSRSRPPFDAPGDERRPIRGNMSGDTHAIVRLLSIGCRRRRGT